MRRIIKIITNKESAETSKMIIIKFINV